MKEEMKKQKGIPRNKWKDEEFIKNNRPLATEAFDRVISDPNTDEKSRKFFRDRMKFLDKK